MILAGESYVNSEVAVKISLIAVVASVLNNYFGVQTLIPTNNSQHLKNVVLKSAMLCLLLSYPIIKLWSYEGAALLLCISEIYLLSGLYMKHKKLKLNIIVQ